MTGGRPVNETEIRAAILAFGAVLDRAEAVLKDIDSKMQALNETYAETVRIHEDAGRNIERLASMMDDKRKAETILRFVRYGTGQKS